MSYWVEDSNGRYLGDLATNKGINDLRRDGPPALRTFLMNGEADAVLMAKVVEETRQVPLLKYIADMLDEASPPVYVTDGCGDAGDRQED